MKSVIIQIYKKLVSVAKSTDFMYFFLIIFTGSLSFSVYVYSWSGVLNIIGMSAVIAFLSAAVLKGAKRYRYVYRTSMIAFACLFNVLAVTDLFIVYKFHKPFDQDIVDILAETNARESWEFLCTYFPIGYLLISVAALVAFNLLIYWVLGHAKTNLRRAISILLVLACTWGAIVACNDINSYLRYRNGRSLPQYTTLTRVLYSLMTVDGKLKDIESVYAHCQALEGNVQSDPADSTVYVVIIGESLCKTHSSLYGYKFATNPKLQARADAGELCVFDDAVSIADHTHTALMSIFSYSSLNHDFGGYPLFPAVFRQAGYSTALYDNQSLVSVGVSFLNNADISRSMFDHRNESLYGYDGDMLASVGQLPGRSLLILHLMGQHYFYSDRFPSTFQTRFNADMYDDSNDEHRRVLASYDNSVLYNDSIVDALISRLEDRDACVIYLSDHGEELFEYGDFYGHGTAPSSPGRNNQIMVPLVVWGSQSFRDSDRWAGIVAARDRKITSDDFSHSITDLAGIHVACLDSTRCFFGDSFVPKHRIVLNSIDFDKWNINCQ